MSSRTFDAALSVQQSRSLAVAIGIGCAVLLSACARFGYDPRGRQAPAETPTSSLDAGETPVMPPARGDQDDDAGVVDESPTDADAGQTPAADAGLTDAATADATAGDAATDAAVPPNPLLGVFYGDVTNDPAGVYQMCAEITQLDQPGMVAGTSRGTDSAIGGCMGLWRVSDLRLDSSTGGRYRLAETITYMLSSCAQQGNGVVFLTSTGSDSILWEWAATSSSAAQATATLQRRSSCP